MKCPQCGSAVTKTLADGQKTDQDTTRFIADDCGSSVEWYAGVEEYTCNKDPKHKFYIAV